MEIRRGWSTVAMASWLLVWTAGPVEARDVESATRAAAASPEAVKPSELGAPDRPTEPADDASEAANPSAPAGAGGGGPLLWSPRTDRGAPVHREGGATRGTRDRLVVLTLVPQIDGQALTLAARPVLHWYLSADSPHAIEFTLVDPDEIDPAVEVTFPGPTRAGIHAVDLADHGAELRVGRRYEWYVAVVPDPADRAADIVAGATVQRIDAPDLAAQVARTASPADAIRMLAGAGIWYEAIERAQREAAREPPDEAARTRLALLLDQVEIELPAD